jgi:hypothetical protein
MEEVAAEQKGDSTAAIARALVIVLSPHIRSFVLSPRISIAFNLCFRLMKHLFTAGHTHRERRIISL